MAESTKKRARLAQLEETEKKRKVTPPLTLTARASLFDAITLRERVDVARIDALMTNGQPNAWQLPRYRALVKEGVATVRYRKPKFGRAIVSGGLGLHNMDRETRCQLARDTFTDWDMRNAHPTILLRVCEAHGIAAPQLADYVTHRDTWLDEVVATYAVTRDTAKNLFLRHMFLGGFAGWAAKYALPQDAQPTERLRAYAAELSRLASVVMRHNPEIVAHARSGRKQPPHLAATVLSLFLQEVECRLLETLFRHCCERGYIHEHVAVLCNDGFMLETGRSRPELAVEFSRLLAERHGIRLEFIAKPFSL